MNIVPFSIAGTHYASAVPSNIYNQIQAYLAHEQALEAAMDERSTLMQAIDAFMDEREDLKQSANYGHAYSAVLENRVAALLNERSMQAEGIATVGREAAQLRDENEALYAAITRAARWHMALRERLVRLGIAIHTDELGEPNLTINLPELASAVETIMGA